MQKVDGMSLTARYITADWCGPCRVYRPIAERVFSELDVPLEFVDVADIAEEEAIFSVPTIVFSDGHRLVGAYPEPMLRADVTASKRG